MYVVCLLFYAISVFKVYVYICLSPFSDCSEAHRFGEGRLLSLLQNLICPFWDAICIAFREMSFCGTE